MPKGLATRRSGGGGERHLLETSFYPFYWIYCSDISSQNYTGFKCPSSEKLTFGLPYFYSVPLHDSLSPQPLQIKLILFILMPLKILDPDKVQVMDLTEKNWISKMPQAQIPWNYNSNKQTKNRTRNQEAAKKAYLWPKLLSTWASAAAQNNINNKQETGSRLILQCQGFVWDLR